MTAAAAAVEDGDGVVYLRVKRPRSLLSSDDDAELHHEALHRKIRLSHIHTKLLQVPSSSSNETMKSCAARETLTFQPIATSLDELPSCDVFSHNLTKSSVTAAPATQSRRQDDGAAAASLQTENVTQKISSAPTEASRRSSNAVPLSDEAYDSLFKGVSSSVRGTQPQPPLSVKKAHAVSMSEAAKDRRRTAAVVARGVLRCERIGFVRDSHSVRIIDAAWVPVLDEDENSATRGDYWNDGAVYDLYRLENRGEDDSSSESSSSSEDHADEATGATSMLFDDFTDEFSFDTLTISKKKRKAHRRRTQLWELDLQDSEAQDRWVVFTDASGMAVCDVVLADGSVAAPLIPEDPREGFDNYVYYDHRLDDEYDSNAEDHFANDYPEEDDSDEDRDRCARRQRRRQLGSDGEWGEDEEEDFDEDGNYIHDEDEDDDYDREDRW